MTMPKPISLSKKYRRVIQLQLNEVSRPIVDALVREGAVPAFAAVDADWARMQTTSERKYEELEPWIQWTTVATGKSYAEHGVFRLGDARERGNEQTWEVLSDHGVESAILGSMNAHRGRARGGLFFPDPWSKQNDAHPDDLRALWTLISRQVQGHAVAKPSPVDLARGAAACLKLRISPTLQAEIAAQLLRSRLDPRSSWRMAGLFDRFLFEIFQHVLRTTRFGFYTLFLNAVAHYQHHYWRQFDRHGFDPAITCPDCHPGDDPVRYGYAVYDRILGQVRKLAADGETLVVVLSGLSQAPFRKKESEGGMNYWRLRDHHGFLASLGLAGAQAFPMMSRDWQVRFSTDAQLAGGRAFLEGLQVDGEQLFQIDANTPRSLFLETKVTRAVPAGSRIVDASGRDHGAFHDRFVRIAVKSGHHVGTGVLWVSDRAAASQGASVPLTSVHRLTLDALGVPSSAPRAAEIHA